MWLVALTAYAVAVFHRASLGVAAVDAQERFSAGASAVSLFLVLQLAVYAALQVPVGVALDRFGSRRMILAGALTMAAGQLVLALATDVPDRRGRPRAGRRRRRDDLHQRAAGDRHVVPRPHGPADHPAHRHPRPARARSPRPIPLVALLHGTSWRTTFLGAAGDRRARRRPRRSSPCATPRPAPSPGARRAWRRCARSLADTWREPGTRIGLYTHLVTQFSGTVFALLWGYPFLVVGQGLSPATAAGLLTLLVVVGMGVGPLLGRLCGRWPLRRSDLVFSILGRHRHGLDRRAAVAGPAPLPLLVVLVVVLGTNGPGSMIGFDYARTENPAERMGSASGVVNVGGFVASLLTILAIGAVLDLLTPGSSTDYSLGAFRAAFAVQYVFWAVGLVGVLRHRRQLRARLARDGVVLAPLYVAVGARLRGGSAYR